MHLAHALAIEKRPGRGLQSRGAARPARGRDRGGAGPTGHGNRAATALAGRAAQ